MDTWNIHNIILKIDQLYDTRPGNYVRIAPAKHEVAQTKAYKPDFSFFFAMHI